MSVNPQEVEALVDARLLPPTDIERVEWLNPAYKVALLPTGNSPLDQQLARFQLWADRKLHHTGPDHLALPEPGFIRYPDHQRLAENQATMGLFKSRFDHFLWTGIECSNPESPVGERWDQLAMAGFYDARERSRQLDRMKDLGLKNLRLGLPNHWMDEDPEAWDLMDDILDDLKRRDIRVSMDLMHFGLPSRFRRVERPEESVFLNPAWPDEFLVFVRQVLDRFGAKLDAITIINEPLVTNRFSGSYWNEAHPGYEEHPLFTRFFVRRALLLAQAAVQARGVIEAWQAEIGHRLLFIHNESCEYQPDDPAFNWYKRFLTSDLILGESWFMHDEFRETEMFAWLRAYSVRHANRFRETDDIELLTALRVLRTWHEEFQQRFGKTMKADTVLGVDYYLACETVKPGFDYELSREFSMYAQEVYEGWRRGLILMCTDYWNRYQLPLLHTETNAPDLFAEEWGFKQLVEFAQLPKLGIPTLGFTWYSLMDQFNWDHALRGSPRQRRIYPVGLYSLFDHEPRRFARTVLPDLMTHLNPTSDAIFRVSPAD